MTEFLRSLEHRLLLIERVIQGAFKFRGLISKQLSASIQMNVGEFYLLSGNCLSRVFLIQIIFNVKDSYHEDAIIYVKGFT